MSKRQRNQIAKTLKNSVLGALLPEEVQTKLVDQLLQDQDSGMPELPTDWQLRHLTACADIVTGQYAMLIGQMEAKGHAPSVDISKEKMATLGHGLPHAGSLQHFLKVASDVLVHVMPVIAVMVSPLPLVAKSFTVAAFLSSALTYKEFKRMRELKRAVARLRWRFPRMLEAGKEKHTPKTGPKGLAELIAGLTKAPDNTPPAGPAKAWGPREEQIGFINPLPPGLAKDWKIED